MPAVYFPIHATYKTLQTNFKPPVPARSAGCCLVIYINESDHNKHIDAATFSSTINTIRGEYLGTDDIHNVYAAELTAIQMAIILFEEKIDDYTDAYIFADNQFSIQAVERSERQSEQYIVKEILDTIDRIHNYKLTCNIYLK